MATRGTAQARRGQRTDGRSGRQEASVVMPTQLVHFDGRDVIDDVPAMALRLSTAVVCSHCGTTRDARFAFCCELVASWGESTLAPTNDRRPVQAPMPAHPVAASSAA